MSSVSVSLDAQDVADFLRAQPDWLVQHSDVFATLTLPNPHGGRALSLADRQVMVVRDRLRTTEQRMAQLLQHADDNQRLLQRMHCVVVALLREPDPAAVPALLQRLVGEVFDLPLNTVRVWGYTAPGLHPWAATVPPALRTYLEQLPAPYCGPVAGEADTGWLPEAASQALVPLRAQPGGAVIGVLALGSTDPAHYLPGMQTDVLAQLGELAGAALSRLPTA